jgi:hypothetical protein
MALIGLSGYSGSGKDTMGILIQLMHCDSLGTTNVEEILKDYKNNEWWIEEKSGWEIKKWAGKLKTIASLLTGIPADKFENQEFKKTSLGPEWNMTVRDFLQKLGTDGLRNGLHENTWVNALMADYKPTQVQWSDGPIGGYEDGPMPNWIITDTRFPNEAQAIKDAGGVIIRVDRPGVSAINAHPSETALDKWDFDYKVWNGSDLVALMFTVNNIIKKINHA